MRKQEIKSADDKNIFHNRLSALHSRRSASLPNQEAS